MEISNKLLCLFSAAVSEREGSHVVEIPRREIETGAVEPGETYRVALISADEEEPTDTEQPAPDEPQPPVEPGEMRYVEIEDIGKQGDGIARVERGYDRVHERDLVIASLGHAITRPAALLYRILRGP